MSAVSAGSAMSAKSAKSAREHRTLNIERHPAKPQTESPEQGGR